LDGVLRGLLLVVPEQLLQRLLQQRADRVRGRQRAIGLLQPAVRRDRLLLVMLRVGLLLVVPLVLLCVVVLWVVLLGFVVLRLLLRQLLQRRSWPPRARRRWLAQPPVRLPPAQHLRYVRDGFLRCRV